VEPQRPLNPNELSLPIDFAPLQKAIQNCLFCITRFESPTFSAIDQNLTPEEAEEVLAELINQLIFEIDGTAVIGGSMLSEALETVRENRQGTGATSESTPSDSSDS